MLNDNSEFRAQGAFGWIDFQSRKSVVLAVSGGSDSTALLMAFKKWADEHQPNLHVICVTVDHGLRPESAVEAREVAALCERLGVAHKLMKWRGEKPVAGVAAAAREARYQLLAQAAREAGTDIIVTGHTADDQAETVLMRSARGTGRGLAGMARLTLFDGEIWIARPFLTESRETLRRQLRAESVVWIDDPTNLDDQYERTRARQKLADDPDKTSMLEQARKANLARRELAQKSADLLQAGAAIVAPGLVKFNLSLLNADDAYTDVLCVLLACSGGRSYPPSRLDAKNLIERLEGSRTCVAGTVVTRKPDGIFLHREMRPDNPLCFSDGIFDNRYRLSEDALVRGWRLQARDPDATDRQETGNKDAPASLVRAALATEPVLARKGDLIEAETLKEPEVKRYLAPFDHFLPEFDLTLANATAALFGRESYPPPPIK